MNADQLETALFNIFTRQVETARAVEHRCENEQNWNGSHDPEGATRCNAPDAKFYEWKEGNMDFEMRLCDGCAEEKGVSE